MGLRNLVPDARGSPSGSETMTLVSSESASSSRQALVDQRVVSLEKKLLRLMGDPE
jgi:hypothetical protein